MEESSPEKGERTLSSLPPRPMAAPWLVYPTGEDEEDQDFVNLCEPHNKIYRKCVPELSRTSYWQSNSHQGWFIILFNKPDYHYLNWKYGDCFLWNPESLETVELPNMLTWVEQENYMGFYGFVLSSAPTNSDSMVYFIFRKSKDLMFCRPGRETTWRTQKLPIEDGCRWYHSMYSYLICVEGKLHIPYYTSYKKFHIVVERKLDLDDDGESLSIKHFEVCVENEYSSLRGQYSLVYPHVNYIESSNELFQVIKYVKRPGCTDILNFKVFKMNFSVMMWEEVHDLGDHVLFLGGQTTASCSATDLGLTRGCIYYTQDRKNILYKFDPLLRRISVSLSCTKLTPPEYRPYWMSMPTNFRVTERSIETDMLGNDKVGENDINCDEGSKKSNGGELKQTGAWATLNQNAIGLIATYLHATDYLRFRVVCRENQLAIPEVKSRMSSTDIFHATVPPWLVFSRKNDTIYNFIDPMCNNKRYLMNLLEFLLDSTIRFSKGGWLLMSRGEKCIFFFNPFTRDVIHLPELPDIVDMFVGLSFSSIPTSSDCKVFVFTKFRPLLDTIHCELFITSRGDAAWVGRIVPATGLGMEFVQGINNPVFYNGNLFCIDRTGTLGFFSPEDFKWEALEESRRPCSSIYECYLVECEGKLLSVVVGHAGKGVRVFRLDWEEKVWVEVESLHKNMLFISRTSCLSAIAPDTSMENRIYFSRFHDDKIVFFSLDTGTYHSVGGQHSAEDFTNSDEQLYSSWVEPSWSKNTVEELNWLDKLSEHEVEDGVTLEEC